MGDATFILHRVLQDGIHSSSAYVTIWDPDTVNTAIEKGLGAVLDVSLGVKSGVYSGKPYKVKANLIKIAK